MKKYSAIIVDDDKDNISLLKTYIKRYCPLIDLKGTSTNVKGAIKLYYNYTPRILFLDIQLNEETIFSFIDRVENLTSQIIFISSHKEFIIKAIHYQAIDFVIKPIEINDLIAAVNRAVHKIDSSKYGHKEEAEELTVIALPSMDRVEVIKLKDIIYCEADGRYTNFHLINDEIKTSCRNLGEYEEVFSEVDFLYRIHHKYIINLERLVNIKKSGGSYCEFENNLSLPIASRRKNQLSRYLKLK